MALSKIHAAIDLLEKMDNIVSRVSSDYDVDQPRKILTTMQAYLKDAEGREDSEGLKDRVQQVRDVAFEIEDAIEEYMLDVPEHFHEHKITKVLHDAAHSVTDSRPLRRLSSRMETIQKKINDRQSMDPFRTHAPKQASSSDGCMRSYKFGDIEKSYHSLSPNLRYCLLYFCNFPANYHVTRGRLVRLWIAERFLEGSRSRTKEEIADEYLNELIERKLVDVHGRDVLGRVKRCQVFPPVRDFILDESEMIRFCTVLPRPNGIISIEKSRRLSLHNDSTNLLRDKNLSSIRTLMTFWRGAEFKAEDLLGNFKLLRVLDFEDSALQSFPEEVVKLTLLRYLSLRNTNINTIPRCIKKLHSLEVLDLRQTCVIELPKQILKLRNLLHLLVDQRPGPNEAREGVQLPSELKCLTSLQKLSLLKANGKNRRLITELGNLVDLRKLGITELEVEAGRDLCLSIQNMEYLSSLSVTTRDTEEFLDLNHLSKPPPSLRRLSLGCRLRQIPRWIRQSNSLARICLKGSKLEHSPLEALQDLPSLVELRLVDAYMGEELEFKPKCFLALRMLYLEQLSGLRKISVMSSEALPQLEKLVLKGSYELQKVPSRLTKLISEE